MLDQIDRAAQEEPAVDDDRIRQAARIASLVVQAEAELEVRRTPGAARRPASAPRCRGRGAARRSRRARRARSPARASRRTRRRRDRARRRASATASRQRARRDRQRAARLHARGRTPPAPCETGCRASADPCGRAARARPTARAGGSSRAGTGTGRSRSAAAPTASTAARASRCASSAACDGRRDLDQAVARRPRVSGRAPSG